MENIEQNETVSFKASVIVKVRLEMLAEREGVTGASCLRNLINREYFRIFGEEE